ncbi:ROK family protein, partial [Actinomyces ruminis]
TIGADVLDAMLALPQVESAVNAFAADYLAAFSTPASPEEPWGIAPFTGRGCPSATGRWAPRPTSPVPTTLNPYVAAAKRPVTMTLNDRNEVVAMTDMLAPTPTPTTAAARSQETQTRPFFDAPGLPTRTGYTIGVDVGGTKTALGIFDGERALVRRIQFPSDAALAPKPFLDGIVDACLELAGEVGTEMSDLRGIGVAVPSYVNYEEGHIVKTTNLPLLRDVPARQYLKDRLGGNVRVLVDNDAHAGALAEHRYGAGRGFRHMLYCPVSTGIASA